MLCVQYSLDNSNGTACTIIQNTERCIMFWQHLLVNRSTFYPVGGTDTPVRRSPTAILSGSGEVLSNSQLSSSLFDSDKRIHAKHKIYITDSESQKIHTPRGFPREFFYFLLHFQPCTSSQGDKQAPRVVWRYSLFQFSDSPNKKHSPSQYYSKNKTRETQATIIDSESQLILRFILRIVYYFPG